MVTLIILALFGIVQAVFYWICIRRKWKYVDFLLFAFAVFCNSWLLPKLLMDPHPYEDGCAMSYNGITMGFCIILGNVISAVLLIVYVVMRQERKI